MNKLGIGVISAVLLSLANPAQAVIIDLGIYDPVPGDGGDATAELAILNDVQLPAYNLANDPDLPPATFGTENMNVGPGMLSIDLVLGDYDYVKLKWDGAWQYYYIGGESGTVTFDSTVFNKNGQPQALSHYTFFSPRDPRTPEGGYSLLMLGLGLFGLRQFGRK